MDHMTTTQTHRSRHDASVEFNRPICDEHFILRLRIQGSLGPTRPGQFIQLGCRPPAEAIDSESFRGAEMEWSPGQRPNLGQPELCSRLAMLRRPFSFAGRGDDDQGTWIEIIHRVVGVGTDWLSHLETGDPVDFIGPLGNAFALPKNKSRGFLVGGGVGIPPMFYLAETLRGAGWDGVGFVGALSRNLQAVSLQGEIPSPDGVPVPCVAEFSRHGFNAVVNTDDGSVGMPGRITAGLERTFQSLSAEDIARAVVFVCGPNPMMRAVGELAARYGIDCQVCVEQAMACGMGTCQSCIVKIDPTHRSPIEKPQGTTANGRPWRFKLACTDGPVFASTDVVW